ncbi:MAG: hypothetical protein GC145_16325 [Caulobacter sp.]|nr:hypothetical protein [Caulobacter sp.]
MSRAASSALRPVILALALGLAAMTLAVLPALPQAAWAQGSWRTHKDSKYGYLVEFPGVPSLTQETTPGGAVMDIASLEAGTTGAFLVVSTGGAGGQDPKIALDNATTGSLGAIKGEVISKADLTVDGAPARDLVIRSTDSGVTMHTRMIIQGDNFFQVMAVGPIDGAPEGADRFINSFRIVAPPKPTAPGTMNPVPDKP